MICILISYHHLPFLDMGRKAGKSAALAAWDAQHKEDKKQDDVYRWLMSCLPIGTDWLPRYEDMKEAIIDECIAQGLTSRSLVLDRWQVVLEAGMLCVIEVDVEPSAPPPPGMTFTPPVFTPSRKHTCSASLEDPQELPDFNRHTMTMPGPTPTPAKHFRWADVPLPLPSQPPPSCQHSGEEVPTTLLKALSEVLFDAETLPIGSLAAMLSSSALSHLVFLLGEHLPS